MVSIDVVRERERESGGFLQCKNIAYIALELVDKVHTAVY